jgi:hypothetical protein
VSKTNYLQMIVFNLSCDNHHRFEGWFESSANFDSQMQSKLLNCPFCGTDQISKELHAPYVNTGAARPPDTAAKPPATQQAALNSEVAKLIDHLIANTDDVGNAFPEEARKIHYREVPERRIRGNASSDEVKDLREEGIEVISVPIPKYRLGNPH